MAVAMDRKIRMEYKKFVTPSHKEYAKIHSE